MRTEKTKDEINNFVDSLFTNGKTPSEAFGTSWNKLCQLEADHPEMTVKSALKAQKTA